MPLFYFDIFDGEGIIRDEEGTECRTFKAARRAAIEVLPALARDASRGRDQQNLVITMRNADGEPVFIASLVLVARNLP